MSPADRVPSLTLNDGRTIPQVGFGVFQVPPEETYDAVTLALDAGYRSIDTARIYRNEEAVGRAIADHDVDRADVVVTTKLWNTDQGHDSTLAQARRSLELLGLEQIDLYLIHWPAPAQDLYVPSWVALEELQADGLVRSIGVSNFTPTHLQRLLDEASVVPAVNQVELHPDFPQPELRAFHAEHGIVTEAWSPLAQGDVLGHPDLVAIAETHDATPAQVVLRWHVQLGTVVIPKSVTPERIRTNLDLFDLVLTDDEMATVGGLGSGKRRGPHPDEQG